MEKYISAIEISDTQIRLAVGYINSENKLHLVHVSERPIHGLVSNGDILDYQTLSSIVASMKEFKDEVSKEKITINEAVVVLPSIGLNVFQSSKTSNVVSPYSIIAQIDIENVVFLVQKETIPGGSEIVDIIPDQFVLEKGRSFINPPINEKSDSITIKAKIHTLPAHIINDYKRVFDGARIKVHKMCVNSYALAELAKNCDDIPESYILVDIGADVSNVSLVGNTSVYETVSFMSGSSHLINKIGAKFGLSFDESLELLRKYGLDERELTYRPVIATSFVDGLETHHDPESLNKIIKEFFEEEYLVKFDVAYETLMKGYQDNVRNLPVVFTGGLTKMFGFEGIVKNKFVNNASIHYLEPKCIGARDSSYSALIGAMYASWKYKGALSDTRAKANQISRDKNENA